MKLKTWHYEHAVIVTVLAIVWFATRSGISWSRAKRRIPVSIPDCRFTYSAKSSSKRPDRDSDVMVRDRWENLPCFKTSRIRVLYVDWRVLARAMHYVQPSTTTERTDEMMARRQEKVQKDPFRGVETFYLDETGRDAPHDHWPLQIGIEYRDGVAYEFGESAK